MLTHVLERFTCVQPGQVLRFGILHSRPSTPVRTGSPCQSLAGGHWHIMEVNLPSKLRHLGFAGLKARQGPRPRQFVTPVPLNPLIN
jgi:hypothetical protein